MNWKPHGLNNLYWKDDYLIMELRGSFNREGAVLCDEKAMQLVKRSCRKQWSLLIKLESDTLLTPDAVNDVTIFFNWCLDNGCLGVAYELSNRVQSHIADKIFTDIGLPHRCFNSEVDAFNWLNVLIINRGNVDCLQSHKSF